VKPTSVIALIVAVMLIIIGFVTCLVAQNIAEAEGQQLFTEVRDYGLVNTVDLADTPISKLEIRVENAKVNVYGRSQTSYIELINFRENYYSLNTANRVVTFDEYPDILSMLKFWENGFSFKGMRYLLDFQKEPEGDKVINIYLSKDTTDLKILNLSGTQCDLHLENLTTGTDFHLEIQNGSVTGSQISTNSVFQLDGEKLALDLNTCHIANLKISCTELSGKADQVSLNQAEIQSKTCNLDLTPRQKLAGLNFNVQMGSGSVSVGGNALGSKFIQTPAQDNGTISIKAENGNVTMTDPAGTSAPGLPVTNG